MSDSRHSRGFTLVEILAALAIFSLVAVGALSLLSNTAAVANDQVRSLYRQDKLALATGIIESDIRHLAPQINWSGPETDRALLNPVSVNADAELLIKRIGYQTGLAAHEAEIVNIQYAVRPVEGSDSPVLLRRVSFPEASHIAGKKEVHEQLLVSEVSSFAARVLDESGRWWNYWPPESNNQETAAPKAVAVEVQLDARNLSWRRILVVGE